MASSAIELYQGNTWGPFPPSLKYSDGSEFTMPPGATVLFTVKSISDEKADDSDAFIKKDWSSGVWSLSSADTSIPCATYKYDVKIIREGEEINSDSGNFIVKRRLGIRDING